MSWLSEFMDPGRGYGSAENELRDQQAQAREGLDPFRQAGQAGIGALQTERDKLLDPSNYLSHLMQGYQTSDYAKNLMSQATQQGLGAAQQMGLGGSSSAQRNIATAAGNVAAADQQNYLKNLMGIEGMGLGTAKDLYSGGLQSALGQSQLAGQFASPLAAAKYGESSAGGDLFGKLGGAAIGGLLQGLF